MNMSTGVLASYSSAAHMRSSPPPPPPPDGETLVKAIDQDQSGSIGLDELSDKEYGSKLAEEFFQIDTNQDSELSAEELDVFGQTEQSERAERGESAPHWNTGSPNSEHVQRPPPPPPQNRMSSANSESVIAALILSSSQNSAAGASQSILQAMYNNTQSLFAS